jgi:putative chitinase
MRTRLQFGDQGVDVDALQQALLAAGFSPGAIDGQFGAGTLAALQAFQMSRALLADGVAGPRTLAALGLLADDTLPDATSGMTLQIAARMFPLTPLANIKANLPVVLAALGGTGLHDRTMVLMALATIRAETESFLPVSEGQSRFNTSPGGRPFDLYDHRGDLGNLGPPDGERYRGRGFIQLTGRSNYATFGPRLSLAVDLTGHPELANASDIAAELLCLFLGARQLQIKDALMHRNFQAARRLVNGGVHGLDRFTEAYEAGDDLLPA